jgi:hypothetical protein
LFSIINPNREKEAKAVEDDNKSKSEYNGV